MTALPNLDLDPGYDFYGSTGQGDMSADEFAIVSERVFGGDPRSGLIAVLKIYAGNVDHYLQGSKPVPAPLAIALLRCCHGLPILKRIRVSLDKRRKTDELKAKDDYALIMNAPNALSSANGDFQQFCAWAAQLTQFVLMRLCVLPDNDQ
jgi:hypothetical protein